MCQSTLRHTGPSTAAGWESWPVFDPRHYGAKADGSTLDTPAIQAAIEAASAASGGRIVLRGGTFLTGSLFLKPYTALVIDAGAVLKGTTDWRAYPLIPSRHAGVEGVYPAGIVNAWGVHGVRISGGGTLDGSGFIWWNAFWARARQFDKMDSIFRPVVEDAPQSAAARDLLDRPGEPKPLLIGACRDVLIDGIHIRDSATWTLHAVYCEDVEIRGVTIRNASSRMHAPCTDGIDIDSCRNVHVHHCDIACHDDCICLKSGRGLDGARVNRPTENVLIHDCVSGAGHALVGLGTEFAGGIRNVVIRNCRAEGTQMGLRFKSNIGNGGVIENVMADTITCVNTAYPIQFRLRDAFGVRDGKPGAAAYVAGPAGIPAFRNVTIRNLTATGAKICLNTIPYADQTFDNVILENVSLEGEAGLQVYNARNWDLRGVTRAACSAGPFFDIRDSRNILLPAWHEAGGNGADRARTPGGAPGSGAGQAYFHQD